MVKRLGNLYPQITDFDNLYQAYRLARKGKGDRPDVARFELNLEAELIELQRALVNETYLPGGYKHRTIYERKPRLISIAPFRDRVVHHALMRVVDPLLDPILIHDCYACRQGKGVHRAADRYQQWAGQYPYVLKMDIASYFASIEHKHLKLMLRRKLKDSKLLGLFDLIIDSYETEPATGLPIGNLTSQFLANYYLNGFDHWLKEHKGCKGYLRYVDDFFVFGREKAGLWQLVKDINQYLNGLGLELHPNKISLLRTSERIDVLGYMLTHDRRWLRNDNGYRFRRKLNQMAVQYGSAQLDWSDAKARIQSWIGHAVHGQTRALRSSIFKEVTFRRAVEPT